MALTEKFNISHEMLKKYEKEALDCFEKNKYRFKREYIALKCEEATLCREHKRLIFDFVSFAEKDEDIIKFMWLYYYLLFETKECYLDNLWEGGVDDIPVPPVCEKKFPGAFKSVIYLLASDHLSEFLKKNGLSAKYLKQYYEKYKGFAEDNIVTHDTYGLCRLAPFMYAYAYPFIANIGRLTFEIRHFRDFCEVYENEKGERVLIATPKYAYNQNGLRDDGGSKPAYILDGNTLIAHTFSDTGRLVMTPERFDMTKLSLVFSEGDMVASIHIPRRGKLLPELVEASIREADKTIPKIFPKFKIKGYVCQTWLLDTQLRGVLKEGSNILKFQDKFDIVMLNDNKNHSLFDHIFNVKPTSLENLVPGNDFQKKMLDRALRGEKIYWAYGILKKENKRNGCI